MATISVRGLTIEHRSGPYLVRPILDLDLDLTSGQLVVVLGASGCGKTSLLSVLAGILTPAAGEVTVDGQPMLGLSESDLTTYRRHTVGIVFQSFNLVPSLTAWENVAVPLWTAGIRGRAARERADELLAQVGLSDRSGHRPSELSGGQQQRVAIARSLAHDPPVILADEPTAHLDGTSVEEVVRVLRTLATPGRVVVIATHDHRLVPVADRVVELTPTGSGPRARARRRTLKPGQILFEMGDPGDLVYLVEGGSVEVVRPLADGGTERLTTIDAGGYLGELAPMFQLPRAATARAGPEGAAVRGITLEAFRRRAEGRDASTASRKRVSARGGAAGGRSSARPSR